MEWKEFRASLIQKYGTHVDYLTENEIVYTDPETGNRIRYINYGLYNFMYKETYTKGESKCVLERIDYN